MIIDPQSFEGFNRVLTGVVVPRPIAFVSTMSKDGLINLAPYSFFNAVAYDPPTIVFSSSRHAGDKRKDTLAHIEETGEFVVNIVVDDIAEAMNRTAAEYPSEVSEFEIAGLTPAPSQQVRPPRVAESPVSSTWLPTPSSTPWPTIRRPLCFPPLAMPEINGRTPWPTLKRPESSWST